MDKKPLGQSQQEAIYGLYASRYNTPESVPKPKAMQGLLSYPLPDSTGKVNPFPVETAKPEEKK
jgi:hypothetical protein